MRVIGSIERPIFAESTSMPAAARARRAHASSAA